MIILGKTDGNRWQELARAKTNIDADTRQQLAVQIRGDRITVWHNGDQKMQHSDGTYDRGAVGLRVVNANAVFSDFHIKHSVK